MPLIKSSSKKARDENIHREIAAGRPIKQAIAIGYSVQRRAKGNKGTVLERRKRRTLLEKD